MNKDNLSALIMAIAVVSVIAGFAVYFNSPGLNKATSSQQQVEKFVSAATTHNTTKTTINIDKSKYQQIDKYEFRRVPEFAQINAYLNTNQNIKLEELKVKDVLVKF